MQDDIHDTPQSMTTIVQLSITPLSLSIYMITNVLQHSRNTQSIYSEQFLQKIVRNIQPELPIRRAQSTADSREPHRPHSCIIIIKTMMTIIIIITTTIIIGDV